jgi:Regulator of ribonuclease activity B
MERDLKQFPEDENGDVLWNMHSDGDNLSTPREVDFSVIFPTADAAMQFAVHMLKNAQKVSFSAYEGSDELPWQVQAHPVMEPNHENITGYESHLADEAAQFGGRNDGWGAMQQD